MTEEEIEEWIKIISDEWEVLRNGPLYSTNHAWSWFTTRQEAVEDWLKRPFRQ